MSDVLGDSPTDYYNKEQARLYELSGAFKRIQSRMTLDALSIACFKPESRVLDLGCGTGFSTIVLKEKGFNVTGCDVNEHMLDYAKKKGLRTVLCDIRSLHFKDEEFDYLISISTIQWVKPREYEDVLREIHRVVKDSAIIQFYPKNSAEFEHFIKIARKLFHTEAFVIGTGNKAKTYIRLKKR
ncbi:MAG: class I SAM-dependent methyltransferase [Nanoarchaeota archaeon]|nr:class I SAM-dependent methyltransferase [Nanoarchaeota archaeon]